MRVDSYAAVNEMVTLTRAEIGQKRSGLVNAVLRKISQRTLDQWIATVAPSVEEDRFGYLAIAKAHPRWVIEAFDRSRPRHSDLDEAHAARRRQRAASGDVGGSARAC